MTERNDRRGDLDPLKTVDDYLDTVDGADRSVLVGLAGELADFETTTGSVHYSADHPVPEELLRRIAQRRREEIDAKAR